jgi:hypothetical protein
MWWCVAVGCAVCTAMPLPGLVSQCSGGCGAGSLSIKTALAPAAAEGAPLATKLHTDVNSKKL